jgi:two-component system, OmpR family, sensor histidine kinase CiaH
MFQSARLRLTAWYLVIIMLISMFFTTIIYIEFNQEIQRFAMMQQARRVHIEQTFGVPLSRPESELKVLTEARGRLIFILILVNAGILVISGGAGYFLAGRTLRPIKEMLDDQKRFITDASHELRTPLTALRSEIEVHLRDKNTTLAQNKDLLKSNLEEVIHLQNLSDGLIRLTNGQKNQRDAITTVSLTEILTAAQKKVLPLARRKHIQMKQEGPDVSVSGSMQSLCELFVILLDNAIKYSPSSSKIAITLRPQRQSVQVSVADEGEGIAEEDLAHIFERFYRADSSRKRSSIEGYGLGLSIAQKIVTEHNGSLRVKSKLNKGTTFIVQLPR